MMLNLESSYTSAEIRFEILMLSLLKSVLSIRNELVREENDLRRVLRITDFCPDENKGADQLRINCKADQCLCFRYMDSAIPVLSTAKISSP